MDSLKQSFGGLLTVENLLVPKGTVTKQMDSLKRSFGGLLTVEMFLKKQRYLKTYKHTLNWTINERKSAVKLSAMKKRQYAITTKNLDVKSPSIKSSLRKKKRLFRRQKILTKEYRR